MKFIKIETLNSMISNSGLHRYVCCTDGFICIQLDDNVVYKKDETSRKILRTHPIVLGDLISKYDFTNY
jgi:hypothetical protein